MQPEILAAGAVLWRPGEDGRPELALIHRPKYGDWTFPKGKLKRGEHLLAAAQREVFEETGIRPVLGRPLAPSFYDKEGRLKRVDYWCATPASDGEAVDEAVDPREVDDLEWIPLDRVADRLTYERDQPVLEDFSREIARETVPIVFVRHAIAMSKADWFDQDELRPLNQRGRERAQQLEVLLAAFPAGAAYSSSSARCLETLLPYCAAEGVAVTGLPEFTIGTLKPAKATARLDEIIESGRPAVVCGHGEHIDEMIAYTSGRLGTTVPVGPLEKGEFVVFHTAGGRIVATEHHD
ncbi:MAG: NUDIX hydrolase [Glycomyces artemisiae]|uniref:NUDIX hydrolase n=1 Tax=Glycomyces artemisiae TaxID=1076443 RepID=A0A850C382_9ACTN|nr:NUDIX hydrolase [Glycomyces artemisiae]